MIECHVTGVMGHYRNSPVLKSWDIANEIIADNENETDNATYGLRRGVKPELIRDLFLIAASVDNSNKFYQIIGYFERRTTSGVVEGINNKLKLIKRSGFGFKNFRNFEIRALLSWHYPINLAR